MAVKQQAPVAPKQSQNVAASSAPQAKPADDDVAGIAGFSGFGAVGAAAPADAEKNSQRAEGSTVRLTKLPSKQRKNF